MSFTFPLRPVYIVPLPDRRELRLGERPMIMGILNVTPDSFAGSVPTMDPGVALDTALQMEADGADLIDVGGESTRPGAVPVTVEEELARIQPVLRALAGRLRIPLSVDTSKASVARAGLEAGAAIVNDVTGLRHGPALAQVVAAGGAALVLMHSRGTPGTMQSEATYRNLVPEVAEEIRAGIGAATEAGVPVGSIIVDPGVGFAKQPQHSYGVLARLAELAETLDRPVLVGPSRKSFMRSALGERPAAERDWGTAAAVTAAVLAGAHIVRVHAVSEMVQVVRVAEQIRRHGLPL